MIYAAAQASISASSFFFLATSPAACEKVRIGARSRGDASSRSRGASAGRRQEGANSTPTIDSRGVDINANQMNKRLPAPVWKGLLNAAVPDELRAAKLSSPPPPVRALSAPTGSAVSSRISPKGLYRVPPTQLGPTPATGQPRGRPGDFETRRQNTEAGGGVVFVSSSTICNIAW